MITKVLLKRGKIHYVLKVFLTHFEFSRPKRKNLQCHVTLFQKPTYLNLSAKNLKLDLKLDLLLKLNFWTRNVALEQCECVTSLYL